MTKKREATHGNWHSVDGTEIAEPFLMTVVGGSNHWMFISSSGALTAGRTNAEQAIFSYETEDRLHRAAGEVGPVTAMRITAADGDEHLWCPFDPRATHDDQIRRGLAKRALSDGVRFTERHELFGLTFSYEWELSDPHGFVRSCRLELDDGAEPLQIDLVDGLRGVLPHGVDSRTQQTASVLVDAYKHSEVVESEIGVYSLTARIVDRPEPAEALLATVAYRHGIAGTTFLDADQFDRFVFDGQNPVEERLRRGRASGYFFHDRLTIGPGTSRDWLVGTDIGWDASRIVGLQDDLGGDFREEVELAVSTNRDELFEFVARADGLQTSADPIRDDRHATNVMFNCMRGGVIPTDDIPVADVRDFVETRNRHVAERHSVLFDELGNSATRRELLDAARRPDDPDLSRLLTEYLPLVFSRRHGDPSRPWNAFNINIRNEDGTRRYYYEGNWRDVFQNWEALLTSFPEYAESAWTVFVNATTADGHNPYRISRDGIDWERPDADDPWAHIGYWGDHQIIYLLKLLELYDAHQPGELARRLNERAYVFADVPYRIAGYDDIVDDPHETIRFDRDHDRTIDSRRAATGADGNLVHEGDDFVRATLGEKLLIPTLAKLANFVVDGGIWMNTQRPEWNDANNALVGNGLSMVTLAYLVRHLAFLGGVFEDGSEKIEMHEPVASWLTETREIFESSDFSKTMSDVERRSVLDALGEAASDYRATLYDSGLGSKTDVRKADIITLLESSREALAATLKRARREDGMFHGYNLLSLDEGEAKVEHLSLMLEGQVAALSSGTLEPEDTVELVDSLFDSPLYRDDQNSFLLYPDRRLPNFLERGIIPDELVAQSPLLSGLADDEAVPLIDRDDRGVVRFSGGIRNARDLRAALERLGRNPDYAALVESNISDALEAWESVFHHHAYTGRSGSMYGYEGLGSIYWHMVSKLNLAVLETVIQAWEDDVPQDERREVVDAYYRLRSGLGDAKEFSEYGAFPVDAYSHTPPNGGARQPGMTGQVKEDILTRRGELGVRVGDGVLGFEPIMLRAGEFATEPSQWRGIVASGEDASIELDAGQLAFTVCQIPVVYTVAEEGNVEAELLRGDGSKTRCNGSHLSVQDSAAIFGRRSDIERIDVRIPRSLLV